MENLQHTIFLENWEQQDQVKNIKRPLKLGEEFMVT
jgi:hypothetical protein